MNRIKSGNKITKKQKKKKQTNIASQKGHGYMDLHNVHSPQSGTNQHDYQVLNKYFHATNLPRHSQPRTRLAINVFILNEFNLKLNVTEVKLIIVSELVLCSRKK